MHREALAEAACHHMIPVALDAIEPGDLPLFAVSANAPAKHFSPQWLWQLQCQVSSSGDLLTLPVRPIEATVVLNL